MPGQHGGWHVSGRAPQLGQSATAAGSMEAGGRHAATAAAAGGEGATGRLRVLGRTGQEKTLTVGPADLQAEI